jgi:ATP-dependent DNA ligase
MKKADAKQPRYPELTIVREEAGPTNLMAAARCSIFPPMIARFFEPMLCLAVPKLPDGPDWQLELKLDGYRGIGSKANGYAHLASRNGKNFNQRFPTIARVLDCLPDETVIDGEIVSVNEDGRPSFNLLQNLGGIEHTILFYAFDLLILAGTDLRSRPLEQRGALLRELIPTSATRCVTPRPSMCQPQSCSALFVSTASRAS